MRSIIEKLFEVKMSTKGQVVIPKPLREAFHFREGETVLMIPVKEGILMRHSSPKKISLRGLLKGIDVNMTECEMLLAEAKRSLFKVSE